MTGRTRRVPVCLWAVILAVSACGVAWAETTIRLEGVPDRLSFPLPEWRNVVLTAIVQGDAAQAVWLATSADAAGRVMLKGGGEGRYQINLADPVVVALLRASEGRRQFRVFARTAGGETVASVAVRYGLSRERTRPAQLFFSLREEELAEDPVTAGGEDAGPFAWTSHHDLRAATGYSRYGRVQLHEQACPRRYPSTQPATR